MKTTLLLTLPIIFASTTHAMEQDCTHTAKKLTLDIKKFKKKSKDKNFYKQTKIDSPDETQYDITFCYSGRRRPTYYLGGRLRPTKDLKKLGNWKPATENEKLLQELQEQIRWLKNIFASTNTKLTKQEKKHRESINTILQKKVIV